MQPPPDSRVHLDGKVTIVTGAASGIGRAAARVFHDAGALLVLADRDEAGLRATAEAVSAAGGEPVVVVADVADAADVQRMVAAAVDRHGRLDCAFNNAGVEASGEATGDLPDAAWQRVIDVDLTGAFLCVKHEINAMLGSGGGSIVNTSSGLGVVGLANQVAYVAAKHGVLGLTRTAALEYATRGIRVNALCPGIVETPMGTRGFDANPGFQDVLGLIQPIGRVGLPAEVAAAALFLLSDAASFVVGTALPVDGGYLAH
jgi:NAD(P)-dependent dehydrogenase (short-subunit alcohol dehydrogenase family)